MSLTVAHITPLISLLAGILILIAPSSIELYRRNLPDCRWRGWPQRNLPFCELNYTKLVNAIEAPDLAEMGEALSLVIGGLDHRARLDFRGNLRAAAGLCAVPALCARPEVSHLGVILLRCHRIHRPHSVGQSVRARGVAGCRD